MGLQLLVREVLALGMTKSQVSGTNEQEVLDKVLIRHATCSARARRNRVICGMMSPKGGGRQVCALVSSLGVRGVFSESEVEAGVEALLKGLGTSGLPTAAGVRCAGKYLAHLLEDRMVPESLLASVPALAGTVSDEILAETGRLTTLPLPITALKAKVKEIVAEYLVCGDLKEAVCRLGEVEERCGQEVVKRTLVEAMEKKNRDREMASVLISALTKIYGSEQFFEGFIRVLRAIDDIALDTPNAAQLLSKFIARAIVDDVLPPVFVTLVPPRLVAVTRVKETLGAVKALMEQHSSTRIMNIWGAGAKHSVEELKEAVGMLVNEYFESGDLSEAVRCVQELEAPHFNHEVVKRVVYRAVELANEKGEAAMRTGLQLLKALMDIGALEHRQLTKGMLRAADGLKDLSLDVPDAPKRLLTLADWLTFEKLVPPGCEQVVLLKMRTPGLESLATILVEEFLVSGSSQDAVTSLRELAEGEKGRAELVGRMLQLSLDKDEVARGAVLDLITALVVRGEVAPDEVEAGLEGLLRQVPELVLDIPKLADYLAHMLAHFLEDRTVPESLLASVPTLAGDKGPAIVEKVGKLTQLPLPVTAMKAKVKEIVAEYFVSEDLHEALARLGEVGGNRCGQEVVKRTLVEAMEKKNRDREMASVLISALTKIYGSEQFFEGFIRVLRAIDDIALDTPNAAQLLSKFIARAIVDDVLPPVFVTLVPPRLVAVTRVKETLGAVKALMEQHSSTRIMNIWGAGAKHSVEELKGAVRTLVEEYLDSGDAAEAVRCVQELDAPDFGHEVVKRVAYRAVERGGVALAQGRALLDALRASQALPDSQLARGMGRAVMGLADLSLDVPDASSRLDQLTQPLVADGLLAPSFKAHAAAMAGAIGA